MTKWQPDQVYQDCMFVLRSSLSAVNSLDPAELKILSNKTIHNASVFQDDFSTKTAMLVYGLAKLVQIREEKNIQINFSRYVDLLKKTIDAVERRDAQDFNELVDLIFQRIKEEEKSLHDVFKHFQTKAKLNKSASMYYHGVSAGRAAEIVGVTQWQLYDYLGKTSINDDGSDSVSNMKKRLEFAIKFFSHNEGKNE